MNVSSLSIETWFTKSSCLLRSHAMQHLSFSQDWEAFSAHTRDIEAALLESLLQALLWRRSRLWLITKAGDVFLMLLLCHLANNRGFPAGAVKIGNFFRQQWFDENSPNFGIIPLFKKENDCAIFHDFIDFLRVRPIFSGTQFLNSNLKENGSVEWAKNWPGGCSYGFLSIPI